MIYFEWRDTENQQLLNRRTATWNLFVKQIHVYQKTIPGKSCSRYMTEVYSPSPFLELEPSDSRSLTRSLSHEISLAGLSSFLCNRLFPEEVQIYLKFRSCLALRQSANSFLFLCVRPSAIKSFCSATREKTRSLDVTPKSCFLALKNLSLTSRRTNFTMIEGILDLASRPHGINNCCCQPNTIDLNTRLW